MMSRMGFWFLTLLILAAGAPIATAEVALKDGDRVVFFGDTAIADMYFTLNLDVFLRVKYPELKAGIAHMGATGSDTADGLKRLDKELLALKPTRAVLCFGLDEPLRRSFDQQRYDAFTANLGEMVDQIRATGAAVTIMTPPPPEESRNHGLADHEYEHQISMYATAAKNVAAEKSADVIDWHAAVEAYKGKSQAFAALQYTRDGLIPLSVELAIATDAILEHWHAEPIQYELSTTWTSKSPVSVSQGTSSVSQRTQKTMTIGVRGAPVPLEMPQRDDISAEDWPLHKWCTYVLRIPDVPGEGVFMAANQAGQSVVPAEQVRAGADMTVTGPFKQHRVSGDLYTYARTKANQFISYHNALTRHVPFPELAKGYRMYAEAFLEMAFGSQEVLLGRPVTMNIQIELRALSSQEMEQAKTAPPRKPRMLPIRRRPGRDR